MNHIPWTDPEQSTPVDDLKAAVAGMNRHGYQARQARMAKATFDTLRATRQYKACGNKSRFGQAIGARIVIDPDVAPNNVVVK